MKKINCKNQNCELESNTLASMGGGRRRINVDTYIPLPNTNSRKPKLVETVEQTGRGSTTSKTTSPGVKSERKGKASPKKSVGSPNKSVKKQDKQTKKKN